ncbi:ras-interacting protein 1 isoform X2 [Heterodontus francisci]|uniref:ras-interacting protein 1 isoform X2 n=1 Tax=Heterodontus francisci TaxID=7792 RepID=UPI00355C2A29
MAQRGIGQVDQLGDRQPHQRDGGAAPAGTGAPAPEQAGSRRSSAAPRWGSERKLAEGGLVREAAEEERPESGRRGAAEVEEEGEEELSVQPGAPGVLKIFGDRISAGANYKSVLATARSSAGGLVKEVLARYSMCQEQPANFLLCDVVGRVDGPAGSWQTQCLRVVGDSERPLVLQEMWRPRRGFSRRFEIRRREDVRRMEEHEDTVTEGINAQARKLQRSRARVSTGEKASQGGSATLRRSISEANLSEQRKRDRKCIKSVLVLEGGGEGQTENTDADSHARQRAYEEMAQTLIRPPADLPYFLLLQGYDDKKDLVLHLMAGSKHIFGRTRRGGPGGGEAVDTSLCAPDILPRHCCVRRVERPGRRPAAQVQAYPGARLTRNGGLLLGEAELLPGDLLGLGDHYLLMYKEPRAPSAPPSWLPASPLAGGGAARLREAFACLLCGRALQEGQEAFGAYLSSREPLLRFRPEEGEEGPLLAEIVARAAGGADGAEDHFKLAPAYLFAICLQYSVSALEPSHLPILLLRMSNLIKKVTWEKIEEIRDKQPEQQSQDSEQPPVRALEDVTSDLQPLMFWMSNSIELLNFAQKKVTEMEAVWECAQADGFSSDPAQSTDFESCEEAMAVLDEVIMYTFQQCVYYLTKTLYSALPGLLDTNPFASNTNPADVQDLSGMPEGVRDILAIYQTTYDLSQQYLVHPDLVSQMFGYLFFFSNASVFNTLMERGDGASFYQWSRAVQIRTNLDLILDWLQGVGLGDIAAEYFRKLSTVVNLLCIPKTNLLKMSWASLQEDHSALSPTQLTHVLKNYHLGPGRPRPLAWEATPTQGDQLQKGEIFASFTDHPPLILPSENFRLCLSQPVPSESFYGHLQHLRTYLWEREKQRLPANQRTPH